MFVDTKSTSASFKELVASDPIKAAIALCKPVAKKVIENILTEQVVAQNALSNINKLISDLLPVEQVSLPAIQAKKHEIESQLRNIEIRKLNEYKIFDLEPLTWYGKDGWPRLAVFSTETSILEFSCKCVRDRNPDKPYYYYVGPFPLEINPKLPSRMKDCYKNVDKILQEKVSQMASEESRRCMKKVVSAPDEVRACLRAQFSMLIPSYTREKINRVRGLFESVFIVADMPKWKLDEIVSPVYKDPLVVGFDGIEFWLIAAFDPTPLEAYIAGECRKPSK